MKILAILLFTIVFTNAQNIDGTNIASGLTALIMNTVESILSVIPNLLQLVKDLINQLVNSLLPSVTGLVSNVKTDIDDFVPTVSAVLSPLEDQEAIIGTCQQDCSGTYEPLCAEYNGEYRAFVNECYLRVANCETNQSWIKITNGECATS